VNERCYENAYPRRSGAARGAGGPPPRNWVHKKIPGCAVELNTQNCAWFGSQISLITAMNFREAMSPEPPTRGSAPGPRWGISVPHLQILAAPLLRCEIVCQIKFARDIGNRISVTLQIFLWVSTES